MGSYTPAVLADVAPQRFADEADRKRGARISRMFDRIAPTYDVLNRLLSARTDVRWRKQAVDLLQLTGRERVLDACTGTGDLAIALKDGGAGEVVGTDFAPAMVELAREKAGDRIHFDVADTTALPFADASFDVATVSFGVRNLERLDEGLRELSRALVPGGRLMVLDFSTPTSKPLRAVHDTFYFTLMPRVGWAVAWHNDAHRYTSDSIRTWLSRDELSAAMTEAGLVDARYVSLSTGFATVHFASRATD